MTKFTKAQKKNFDFKIKQLKEELKTDRHILACLGSVGLTFISDINLLKDYLKFVGEFDLLTIIENDRSLNKEELETIKREW